MLYHIWQVSGVREARPAVCLVPAPPWLATCDAPFREGDCFIMYQIAATQGPPAHVSIDDGKILASMPEVRPYPNISKRLVAVL